MGGGKMSGDKRGIATPDSGEGMNEDTADKFTPGRWTAGLEPHPRIDPLVGYRVRAENGTIIAEIFPGPERVAVNGANAALLSAAPDLLAACRALLERVNDYFPHNEKDRRAVELANVAIRKATTPVQGQGGRR
jgi:hypothetical protein